jgi:TRAP transporter TAXI family solute receptor
MKRRYFLAAGAAILAASAMPAAAQQVISIASNPQGSIFYIASVAVAKVMNDKLKLQVRVQPMGGSSTYIPLLNRGEMELGLTNVDDTRSAFKGGGAFRRPNPNLRLLTVMMPLPLGILVPADSPIKTIADLKGKKLPGSYVAQTTGRILQQTLLASAGLTPRDIREVPAPNLFAGTDLLAAGKVDAATIAPGVAQVQKAHAELASHGGVRFLQVDWSPKAMAAMRQHMPVRPITLNPAPHLAGIVGPTTVMSYSIFLTTSTKMSDDMAYRLTKMLHESRDDLVRATPALNRFDPKRMAEDVGVPFHPGAVKFLTEKGQWPPKD